MIEKYLPIGSVVLLKDAQKKIIILGYRVITKKNTKDEYDYCGYLYPEGFINLGKNLVFNHSDIDKVLFVGYSDDEEKKFRGKMANYKIEEV